MQVFQERNTFMTQKTETQFLLLNTKTIHRKTIYTGRTPKQDEDNFKAPEHIAEQLASTMQIQCYGVSPCETTCKD